MSNVTIDKQATEGLLRGIKAATGAIRLSYGPSGINAVVESKEYPFHVTANDAQTIIQAIEVDDPVEKRGLGFLKELSDKADKDSGDGRKTTLIIAEEIIEQGYKSGVPGLQLKKELDALIPLIEQKIDVQKKKITEGEIGAVATISGESEELGKILQEIYTKIGKDGIITPESSHTYTTSVQYINGVRFDDAGYLSPAMVHDEQAIKDGRRETTAVYENPTILVTKRKISHLNDINPLLQTLISNEKKSLVIFTDDMDSDVASIMVKAHKEKVLNILIIRAPVIFKNYIFEDFAKVTGSTIVEDATGINFKNLELRHLGTCGKIEVSKSETTITGIADISGHIADLKEEGSIDSQRRLAWLQTKTAILKLGANNESELSYKRLKCYDAISSCRLALRDGVVEGGGVCLLSIAAEMPNTEAGNILKEAIVAPYKQICKNADVDVYVADIRVVDAAAVVKNAVRNAISLASTMLTSQIVITLPPKSAEQIAEEALKGKQLRF